MNKPATIVFLAAAVAAASASVFRIPTGRPALEQSLERIITLVPIPKVSAVLQGYLDSGDAEVCEAAAFVRSGRLLHIVERIYRMPAVQEQIRDLETKGIRVNQTLLYIKELILSKNPRQAVEPIKPNSKGLSGFYAQVLSVMPVEKILGEAVVLYVTNQEVRIIFEQLRRRECYEAAREVLSWGDVREDLVRLRSAGLDVDGFVSAAERLLGWPATL